MDLYFRVAKCHRYGRYISVSIFLGSFALCKRNDILQLDSKGTNALPRISESQIHNPGGDDSRASIRLHKLQNVTN